MNVEIMLLNLIPLFLGDIAGEHMREVNPTLSGREESPFLCVV
jgi:hypothetical protein